jgi:hypothetical protein
MNFSTLYTTGFDDTTTQDEIVEVLSVSCPCLNPVRSRPVPSGGELTNLVAHLYGAQSLYSCHVPRFSRSSLGPWMNLPLCHT